MSNIITISDLSISLPVEIEYIQSLNMIERVNEHSFAEISCVINYSEDISQLERLSIQSMVKIEYRSEDSKKILFLGYPIKVKIDAVNHFYLLTLTIASATIHMDFKKKERSFQDENILFSDFMNQIFRDEYQGYCYCCGEEFKKTKMFVQYNETDWEFIKRAASVYHLSVFSNAKQINPCVFLGVPLGTKYEGHIINQTKYKEIEIINGETSFEYIDIGIEFEGCFTYELGDRIKIKNVEYIIFEKRAYSSKGCLKFNYKLCLEERIRQEEIPHTALQGVSIIGKVVERNGDQVKIHLCIDNEVAITNWFPVCTNYSAEKNTGFYIMPEIGDFAALYFPEKRENNAFVKYMVRSKDERSQRIEINECKILETAHGKALTLSNVELKFSASDHEAEIRMGCSNGIQINSISDFKIYCDELVISGKKVTMAAKNEILIQTAGSNILIDKIVHLKGDRGIVINKA